MPPAILGDDAVRAGASVGRVLTVPAQELKVILWPAFPSKAGDDVLIAVGSSCSTLGAASTVDVVESEKHGFGLSAAGAEAAVGRDHLRSDFEAMSQSGHEVPFWIRLLVGGLFSRPLLEVPGSRFLIASGYANLVASPSLSFPIRMGKPPSSVVSRLVRWVLVGHSAMITRYPQSRTRMTL